MSHLETHQMLYPVGMRVERRVITKNSIHKNNQYYVEVKCDCRALAVVRPREIRGSCHGCKKKVEGSVPNALEFKRRFLGNPNGKLKPIDVVRVNNSTSYSIVYVCECKPRTKYVMSYQKWHTRKTLHCHLCASAEGVYIPECIKYKK